MMHMKSKFFLAAVCLVLGFSLAAKTYNVLDFGAKGNGVTLDTAAIQKAINAAAMDTNGQVLIPSGRTFLVSTLNLKAGIDFHLKGKLLISTNQSDYSSDGVIMASNAANLKITGSGRIEGRSISFMTGYDAPNEWWLFKDWRPKMFVLTGCTNLVVRDLTFGDAPFWGLHLLGCVHVLVDHVTVNNRLDVPNCDGIDPDHSRDVEIRRCHLTCGDDAIVAKCTRQAKNFGNCADVHVHDCVIRTQDAGLKIGTETAGDVHDILFERCKILSAGRGLCIQLRDEGNVYNVTFRKIKFTAQYHSDPWWGRGEAISFTAIPRTAQTQLGSLHNVYVENISGTAENSVRVNGSETSRIKQVFFKNVSLKLTRWTKYDGCVFDNRPTTVLAPVETHVTDAFNLRYADGVNLDDCAVRWPGKSPAYFGDSIAAQDATGLEISKFKGDSATHPIEIKY